MVFRCVNKTIRIFLRLVALNRQLCKRFVGSLWWTLPLNCNLYRTSLLFHSRFLYLRARARVCVCVCVCACVRACARAFLFVLFCIHLCLFLFSVQIWQISFVTRVLSGDGWVSLTSCSDKERPAVGVSDQSLISRLVSRISSVFSSVSRSVSSSRKWAAVRFVRVLSSTSLTAAVCSGQPLSPPPSLPLSLPPPLSSPPSLPTSLPPPPPVSLFVSCCFVCLLTLQSL